MHDEWYGKERYFYRGVSGVRGSQLDMLEQLEAEAEQGGLAALYAPDLGAAGDETAALQPGSAREKAVVQAGLAELTRACGKRATVCPNANASLGAGGAGAVMHQKNILESKVEKLVFSIDST